MQDEGGTFDSIKFRRRYESAWRAVHTRHTGTVGKTPQVDREFS